MLVFNQNMKVANKGFVFRYVDLPLLMDMLNTNVIQPSPDFLTFINGEAQPGISFTRVSSLGFGGKEVRVVFDARKLNTKHKMYPYVDEAGGYHRLVKDKGQLLPNSEAEEVVLQPIRDWMDYVVQIDVHLKTIEQDEGPDGVDWVITKLRQTIPSRVKLNFVDGSYDQDFRLKTKVDPKADALHKGRKSLFLNIRVPLFKLPRSIRVWSEFFYDLEIPQGLYRRLSFSSTYTPAKGKDFLVLMLNAEKFIHQFAPDLYQDYLDGTLKVDDIKKNLKPSGIRLKQVLSKAKYGAEFLPAVKDALSTVDNGAEMFEEFVQLLK